MKSKMISINLILMTFFFQTRCQNMDVIKLPKPNLKSNVSVEEALQSRRSVRAYKKENLTIEEVSQLLWAAYGTTKGKKKTCPSAGATYPLELYLVCGEVNGLKMGLYRYVPDDHSLKLVLTEDLRKKLMEASLHQEYILEAPISIVIAADFMRTTRVYGSRGERYVYMEVGHCGQNIHLQCESLKLGTVIIGAFEDDKVKNILKIKEEPLYIMPVGRKL